LTDATQTDPQYLKDCFFCNVGEDFHDKLPPGGLTMWHVRLQGRALTPSFENDVCSADEAIDEKLF